MPRYRAQAAAIRATISSIEKYPTPQAGAYLHLDLAQQRLQIIENGKPTFSSRVIIGMPEHPTPQFSKAASWAKLHPDWTPPQRLIDEGKARYQEPGPECALGIARIEIGMGDIYMHGAAESGKNLFKKSNRTFSNGCIRVEKINELLVRLMGDKAKTKIAQAGYEDIPSFIRALNENDGKAWADNNIISALRSLPLEKLPLVSRYEPVQFKLDTEGKIDPAKPIFFNHPYKHIGQEKVANESLPDNSNSYKMADATPQRRLQLPA